MLMGYPLYTLFLYFCFYAFAGWCMETVYCSIGERRFVSRGFLHGPLCPIYGVGVLLMILFFQPLADNPLVFYLVSTITMSAWEYFVGWFLEVTTHTKYWDYSMHRFNLKGRICLWVSLVWGVLSYVCIFWIHPPVAALIGGFSPRVQMIVAAVLAAAVLADAIATIRELALMTTALNKLQDAKELVTDRLQDAKEAMATLLPESVTEAASKYKERYSDLIAAAERRSRRFRNIYHLHTPKLAESARRDIRDHAGRLSRERQEARAAKRAARQAAKQEKNESGE